MTCSTMSSVRIPVMQKKPDARIIPILLFADGLIAILFSIFAHALGFDPTPDWGRSRIVISILGIVLLVCAAYLFMHNGQSERMKTFAVISHTWALIILIYVWFITFGTFSEWRASTRYYSLLADAFNKGQLHVDVEPGAALLAADDPYNNEGRPPFDDDVWDLSLYKGKLYLYWGPVPALLMAPLQRGLNAPLPDLYPVFFFFSGLLVINSMIVLKMRSLFFPSLPLRTLTASLLVLGLILPIPWSLSIPDVYEAAIGAGQFFLMGGILFTLLAFDGGIRKIYLVLAGLFWACSVGSRAINVFSIFFLAALTLYWLWKTHPNDWKKPSLTLLTPLALGALLIAWYNFARFDSPLEFGLRYQITVQNMNRDMPLAFELDYLPHNVNAYVFQPFRFDSGFPFIRPVGYTAQLQSRGIVAPGLYAAGNVTGILFFAPFLLLAFLPFQWNNFEEQNKSITGLKRMVLYLLAGSFLINFASLLLYYYGQMRFFADVVSQITLLAVFGYWVFIQKYPTVYRHITSLLIAFTLIVSLLLSVTSESGRMEKLNPTFVERVNSFFIPQK